MARARKRKKPDSIQILENWLLEWCLSPTKSIFSSTIWLFLTFFLLLSTIELAYIIYSQCACCKSFNLYDGIDGNDGMARVAWLLLSLALLLLSSLAANNKIVYWHRFIAPLIFMDSINTKPSAQNSMVKSVFQLDFRQKCIDYSNSTCLCLASFHQQFSLFTFPFLSSISFFRRWLIIRSVYLPLFIQFISSLKNSCVEIIIGILWVLTILFRSLPEW